MNYARLLLSVACLVCTLDSIKCDMVVVSEGVDPKCMLDPFGAKPRITELRIRSRIENRFVRTYVKSVVINPTMTQQEITFFEVIPQNAFVSRFCISINGKKYKGRVEERSKAMKKYEDAVKGGKIAARVVTINVRNSNKFQVWLNVKESTTVIFHLTYEELLERTNERYQHVINIYPEQLVPSLTIRIKLNESMPLSFVRVLPLTSSVDPSKSYDIPDVDKMVVRTSESSAIFWYNITCELQQLIIRRMVSQVELGLIVQLVFEYDVEREPKGGEIVWQKNYFAHFFAPKDLTPIVMHVVFVMDTSASMWGVKLKQMKEAMTSIMRSLKPGRDFFTFVEFNTAVNIWNLNAPTETIRLPDGLGYSRRGDDFLSMLPFPAAYPTNNDTIEKAIKVINGFQANLNTNTYDVLSVALYTIKLRIERSRNEKMQPLIFFLTDGEPTIGITDPDAIVAAITAKNIYRVPIISISFGDGTMMHFLETLSLANEGYARFVHLSADATEQLKTFYEEVSSPLLKDIDFKYPKEVNGTSQTDFPVFYAGSELVTVGRSTREVLNGTTVDSVGQVGLQRSTPVVLNAVTKVERIWAYKTIRYYLGEAKSSPTNSTTYYNMATELSVQYQLLTPLTSMLVMRDEIELPPIDIVSADKAQPGEVSQIGGNNSSIPKKPARPFQPTPIPIPPPFQSTIIVKLPPNMSSQLAWLERQFRNDRTIGFLNGQYGLGIGARSPANQTCTTPTSKVGSCKLVADCPQLYPTLRTPKDFIENVCVVGISLAGLCCP